MATCAKTQPGATATTSVANGSHVCVQGMFNECPGVKMTRSLGDGKKIQLCLDACWQSGTMNVTASGVCKEYSAYVPEPAAKGLKLTAVPDADNGFTIEEATPICKTDASTYLPIGGTKAAHCISACEKNAQGAPVYNSAYADMERKCQDETAAGEYLFKLEPAGAQYRLSDHCAGVVRSDYLCVEGTSGPAADIQKCKKSEEDNAEYYLLWMDGTVYCVTECPTGYVTAAGIISPSSAGIVTICGSA